MNISIYKRVLGLLVTVFFLYSCEQEEVSIGDIPRENSTNAVVSEESITVAEGDDPTFTIVQENLVPHIIDWQEFWAYVSGQIGVRVVGGTAVEGVDYTFNIPLIPDVSVYLLQDGRYYSYNANTSLEHTVSGIINIIDDGVSEGTETIELEFFPVGLAAVIINDTITINITD